MDPSDSPSGESGEDVETAGFAESVGDAGPNLQANISETMSVITTTRDGEVQAVPDAEGEAESPTLEIMSSRAYQFEMLDQSLKRNVIVAMDTGSGKTQVAVLRIKAELERGAPEKIIWFLAPTVSLCAQQYEVIRLQIASVSMKLLTGNEKVDTWSNSTWTTILEDARVIVSTYQVLLDALCHAFVKMESLALLVIDEGRNKPAVELLLANSIAAHNCVGKHAGSKVMTDFYHKHIKDSKPVPAILGLTASPIMRSKIEAIDKLEATLNAVCVSPTLHREELLKCVNKPLLSYSEYERPESPDRTPTMRSLDTVYRSMDIATDPYILKLLADGTDRSRRALVEAVQKHDTFSQNQMRGFWGRCREIHRELGNWAADFFVSKAIHTFLERAESLTSSHDQWLSEERVYLRDFLRQVTIHPLPSTPEGELNVSHKVSLLLERLLSVQESVVGIVFVKERATVTIIAELLSSYPAIVEKYRIGKMVGTSNYHARKKNLYEFNDGADLLALQNFRSGKINLLIATSVLEEGIDVPACNLVICFDAPTNLKGFIQRRGRARMRESKLVLLIDRSARSPLDWEDLERQMKEQYQEDERELQQLGLLEDSEDTSSASFIVKTTGARLDFDNAKSHLEHFCRVLASGEYVDCRPDYIIHRSPNTERALTATVLLPSFLRVDLRRAKSVSAWQSEKNATKDAAFQAYIALYKAGLINDNLLPFKLDEIPGVEDQLPEVTPEPPYNPWPQIAEAWQGTGERWLYTLTCKDENGSIKGHYEVMLPIELLPPRPIRIYLDSQTTWELSFSPATKITHAESERLPDHTSTLLALQFTHRWSVEDRSHVIKVTARNEVLQNHGIGSLPFHIASGHGMDKGYLLRDRSQAPFVYVGVIPSKPSAESVQKTFYGFEDAPEDVPYVSMKKWTRRADFLHRLNEQPSNEAAISKPYSWVYPVPWTMVDTIPKRHVEFGMLIPAVIHELEVMIVATELTTTLLRPIEIGDLQLVREAISARSAAEPVDYERLEFLGDSILKFCVIVQASADHLGWPEGYLSLYKDRLISNSRLQRASLVKGLTKFILSKPFTGLKWRPLYLDDLLKPESKILPDRKLGSKTPADVVESLIGASYVDGGMPKTLKCISLFLDEVKWVSEEAARDVLFNHVPKNHTLPPTLEPLEDLIGYSFQKKALLVEAMTHASYVADTEQRSLERLEFLGDAVLDNIIVTRLFGEQPPLQNYEMHMLKTAMVNGDFLAFVSLEHGLRRKEAIVNEVGDLEQKETNLPLWTFMRHASPAIGLEQGAMETRFQSMRGEIIAALEHGTHYPWALLARLQAKKFYSDLFEALLGAVWIDSGSLETCKQILKRFSILPYLDRILRDRVHMQHPKEELGKLAVAETVNYAYEVIESGDGEREFRCKVTVGERLVAEVKGGVNREEVKTKAAEEAVRFLTAEQMVLD
ncbi:Fc.00g032070.m01.CDS01 [Cosmosporella sp. VM-42]